MRIVIVLLVVLAAVAAALFALGVFDEAPSPDAGPGLPQVPPNASDPDGTGALGGSNNTPPDTMPALEVFPLEDDLGVLLLAGYAERIPATLAQHWGKDPKIHVHAWIEHEGEAGAGSGTPTAAALMHVTKVDHVPVPADLETLDIDVLAVHGVSPESLGAAFWEAVAERVKEGRLGLLVMPGRPEGGALLEQPALAEVLPLAKPGRMEGNPVPGVLGKFVPFEVTSMGQGHPASRLVAWPEWSATLWQARAAGDYPWGTQQTWPVEAIADGAVELLRVVPPRGDPLPVMVAGLPGDGRALFFGAFEILTRKGYGQPAVMKDTEIWIRNWLAWLAARDR